MNEQEFRDAMKAAGYEKSEIDDMVADRMEKGAIVTEKGASDVVARLDELANLMEESFEDDGFAKGAEDWDELDEDDVNYVGEDAAVVLKGLSDAQFALVALTDDRHKVLAKANGLIGGALRGIHDQIGALHKALDGLYGRLNDLEVVQKGAEVVEQEPATGPPAVREPLVAVTATGDLEPVPSPQDPASMQKGGLTRAQVAERVIEAQRQNSDPNRRSDYREAVRQIATPNSDYVAIAEKIGIAVA